MLYTVNFAFGSMRAYYEVQITQEDLPVISELSGQYGIPLCIVDNKMATTQEFDIYSTADESTLVDELQIQFGTFRSVFYKESVQIRFHAFEDYEVPEKPVKLFFVGNQRQDFEKALSAQVSIQVGIMYQQDASAMLAVIWIAWGILIAFAFFLSAFDAESKRRTSFVRIMNGASPLQILACQYRRGIACNDRHHQHCDGCGKLLCDRTNREILAGACAVGTRLYAALYQADGAERNAFPSHGCLISDISIKQFCSVSRWRCSV